MTGAALYFPIKKTLGEDRAKLLLENGRKDDSLKKKQSMEKIPSKMFVSICRFMTKMFFADKAGLKNVDHSKDNTEVRFDILSCPYYNTLKELGCPEVCEVYCVQDEYSYRDMRNCEFERTGTKGRGNDKCDFCHRVKIKK